MRVLTLLLAVSAFVPAAAAAPLLPSQVVFSTKLGEIAEIPAYDASANRIFVVGSDMDAPFVQIVDAASGAVTGQLDTSAFAGGLANSVAVGGGRVAVAIEAANKTDPGRVLVYDLANVAAAPQVFTVGALPDQLTFTPDGSRILVANEGEPQGYEPGQVDPQGSVSVINLAAGTVATADFAAFNGQEAVLRAQGVRIFGPGASAAQDLEPEYIAVAPDGRTAFVTLQENNAIGLLDLSGTPAITDIVPLGFKSYAPGQNALDPSDRDGIAGNFLHRAGLYGLYQPDAIATFTAGGQTYIVTANEGDARDYDGFEEERRAGAAYGAFARLEVTNTLGADGPAAGDLFTFGGRGFSIRTADGTLVYDSGDRVERIIAGQFPAAFDDGRSDAKGPEPEEVEIGMFNGGLALFLGLERANGDDLGTILAFSLENFGMLDGMGSLVAPNFLGAIVSPLLGRPEGLAYFRRDGRDYLAVADEETGNLVLFQVPAPAVMALFGLGVLAMFGLRRHAWAPSGSRPPLEPRQPPKQPSSPSEDTTRIRRSIVPA